MNECKKCGAVMLTGSKFCGRCGTSTNTPLKTVCPKCKSEVAGGFVFCNKCGAKLDTAGFSGGGGGNNLRKTLIISREMQLQLLTNTYEVKVNGNMLGNVAVGKPLSAQVSGDTATVEVICTTLMANSKLKLVIKMGHNPKISFKVQLPGTIKATVYDADILDQQTNY